MHIVRHRDHCRHWEFFIRYLIHNPYYFMKPISDLSEYEAAAELEWLAQAVF